MQTWFRIDINNIDQPSDKNSWNIYQFKDCFPHMIELFKVNRCGIQQVSNIIVSHLIFMGELLFCSCQWWIKVPVKPAENLRRRWLPISIEEPMHHRSVCTHRKHQFYLIQLHTKWPVKSLLWNWNHQIWRRPEDFTCLSNRPQRKICLYHHRIICHSETIKFC